MLGDLINEGDINPIHNSQYEWPIYGSFPLAVPTKCHDELLKWQSFGKYFVIFYSSIYLSTHTQALNAILEY